MNRFEKSLLIILIVCTAVLFGIQKLGIIEYINNSIILKKLTIVFIIMFVISHLLILIIWNLRGIVSALFISMTLYTISLSSMVHGNLFGENRLVSSITLWIMIIVFFLLLFNIYIITYKISSQQPNLIIKKELKNCIRQRLLANINRFENYVYKINFIIVPLLFIILVIFIIFNFAYIYEAYTNNYNDRGLYYNSNITESGKVYGYDLLYFSSTTFFTVGYGDIIPIGDDLKLIIQLEMIIGYVLSIIYIPTIFILFAKRFNEKQKE